VVEAARAILAGPVRPTGKRPPLWDGHAGKRIADVIVDWLSAQEARGVPDAAGAARG
jgi:UDP-N-acetylglucosamine 2-epimerase (non-hydrolysing)